MSTGSSPIIYSTGLGPRGPDGTGGTGGPEGPPGNTGFGVTGNTGFGVTGIRLVSGGIGFSFGINGTSGATLLFADILGLSGISFGKGTNSIVFLNLTGTTTTGSSILGVNSKNYKGILNQDNSGYSFDTIRFSNLIFSNITVTAGATTILLTGLSAGQSSTVTGASANNLARGITVESGITKINFSNSNWISDKKLLELRISQLRETNISGGTGQFDNYRKDSVGTLATETQFSNMNIQGITGPVTLSKPISTISGNTLQSALYLFDGYTSGSTNSHILWFRSLTEPQQPQERGPLKDTRRIYGSCVLSSGNCVDYVTQAYCTQIGGTFFGGQLCDGVTLGKRGCCYWNLNSSSFKCQDARPDECKNFNGTVKTFPCSHYATGEACLNICLPCDDP
jgi:hypothetical protein